MPRYMIIVKATKESEAGVRPTEEAFAEMAEYHEQLAKAGVLLDAAGLSRTSEGWRIEYRNKDRSFVDGPFAETKELVAGYTIIKTKTREEAIAWTKRFPNPAFGGNTYIEVRRLMELEDFGESPALDRFKEIELSK